jgi:hypothetical protein
METEPDPRMMQFIEVHQEIPKREAAVIPVRRLRKQRRVCDLATELALSGNSELKKTVDCRGHFPPYIILLNVGLSHTSHVILFSLMCPKLSFL